MGEKLQRNSSADYRAARVRRTWWSKLLVAVNGDVFAFKDTYGVVTVFSFWRHCGPNARACNFSESGVIMSGGEVIH